MPYFALIELGSFSLALNGSWGPHSCLRPFTTSYCLISNAIHEPVVKELAIKLNSGITPLKINFNLYNILIFIFKNNIIISIFKSILNDKIIFI